MGLLKPSPPRCYRLNAFTLAEILIALGLLGVIAAFTIPKVLSTSNNQKYTAMAKEVAATIAEAYQSYSINNAITATTRTNDVLSFINYAQDLSNTGLTLDNWPGAIRAFGGGLLLLVQEPSSALGSITEVCLRRPIIAFLEQVPIITP
jgi:prepilin-type N-terminal cleavage/methylation domain-containing protein